jgi:hypothetical protein
MVANYREIYRGISGGRNMAKYTLIAKLHLPILHVMVQNYWQVAITYGVIGGNVG